MAALANQTCSLTFPFNFSIPGIYSFLDVQFRDMIISVISSRSSSNQLSECIRVILKPRCKCSFLDCLIPYSMPFTFQFLIIIPMVTIICQYVVFSNSIPLMCMRSHHRETFLYLSRMPLGTFSTMIGSTCWTLQQTIFPCKCGTLGPYVCSYIPTSSCIIGMVCSILLSTACKIFFTGWPLM